MTFHLGPLGYMKALDGVQAGVSVEASRPVGELITSAGVRWAQRPKYTNRTWNLACVWAGPEVVAWLQAAASGLVPGDLWFFDPQAAAANALYPHQVAGTGGGVVSVDGVPLRNIIVPQTVRVLGGQQYTLSGWGDGLTYKVGSGSTVTVTGGVGRFARTFTPGSDAVLTITASGNTAGLRLATGPDDGKWAPGEGAMCRVAVEQGGKTLQAVWGQEVRSDYQFIVREVGVPGSV